MQIIELLKQKKFVVTSEIGPPKGWQVEKQLEKAELLRGKVDAINATDNQSSVMRLGSLALCHLLKEKGLEPIFQITCRDRNRLALQSDILSAYALGVENILLLTGDHPKLGDHPSAKPVFDLDSVSLIYAVKQLELGKDLAGNKLEGTAPKFCIGAVVSPFTEPMEPQILKLTKKINAGAQFIQTQCIYDLEKLEKFMELICGNKLDEKTYILGGVTPLKSAKMAKFMRENVSGIVIPDEIILRLEKSQDQKKEGIKICIETIEALKKMEGVAGVHVMAIAWEEVVPEIVEKAGLLPRPKI